MAIHLIEDGRRVYFAGDTYAIRDRIKALGGHWDSDSKRWWVGAARLDRARDLVAHLVDAPAPRAAASVGFDPATPAGIIADRLEETGRGQLSGRVRAGGDIEDPDKIRLTGKGDYKGRSYYMGHGTADGCRVRLLTLPDAQGVYRDFWVDAALVKVTKTYTPRARGLGHRGAPMQVVTTLGSIARFLRRQADPASRRGACFECGSWGPSGEPCSQCGGEGSHA